MKTIDISGFGGSYEWGCQRMLQLGIQFLKENPDFDFSGYKNFKNIIGIFAKEPENGKRLDEAIMNDIELKKHGVTGAMHQAVIQHLAYIHKNGYEKWVNAFMDMPDRIYEFEEKYPYGCPTDKPGGELLE
jgi:hypothetical protein